MKIQLVKETKINGDVFYNIFSIADCGDKKCVDCNLIRPDNEEEDILIATRKYEFCVKNFCNSEIKIISETVINEII